MRKEIINNETYCSPQTLEDIKELQSIEQNSIVISFVATVPDVSKAIIGCLMDMKRMGKNILVVYSEKAFEDSLVHLTSCYMGKK